MINVSKIDETLIRVRCDDGGTYQEISEFFTFFAEGYKFMPAYKNKMWDGKIRLFNLRNNSLPFGLLDHLKGFAKTRNYEITVDPKIDQFNKPSFEELVEYVSSMSLSANGKVITMRDYQFDGFSHAIRDKRSLLISPTGSGKSLIIYMLIRWYLDNSPNDKMALIIVPTTSLVEQMQKDFADYSSNDDEFDAENEVHKIYSGKEKFNFKGRVVVTTWQSAAKLDRKWFLQFGMVVGDEAHQFKAKSLNDIMSKLVFAEYRIGTTGTIDNIQCNKLVLIGNFGPVHKVVSTKDLMDANTLAKLKINCIILRYPDEVCKAVVRTAYQDEIDYIISHEGRNRFIRNLAIDIKGNTLVLFNYVEKHGKPLFKLILNAIGANRKVFFVSGAVAALQREEIRRITETEKDAIIVASLGTFSVGVNIRNVHNIIFASPTKSQIRVLQSIGRGLRKADNGQDTTLYDISDNFSWRKSKNYTLKHAIERTRIYDSEQFDYSTFEIPIK
jgi:superfamily II DNA or RNA helicase